MYICICNCVTDTDLTKIIEENPNITLEELQEMNIADNCYKCVYEIEDFLTERR